MVKIKPLKQGGLALALILSAILLFVIFSSGDFIFNFHIDETGEPLNGKVYFEDIQTGDKTYLGETENGVLKYDSYDLYPGNIILVGRYSEKNFSFSYDLTKEQLDLGETNYVVTENEISNLGFDFNQDNLGRIRDDIFNLINSERELQNIEKLERNIKLDEVAQDYSDRMLNENFYAHTDPQGKNVYDRLIAKKIFYTTATENLDRFEIYSKTEIADSVVYGWIDSPGHRVPVLDEDDPITWDSVGIGLSCGKIEEGDPVYTCFAVAVFAGLNDKYVNEWLNYDYLTQITLYPKEYDFDYNTTARIEFNSSSSATVILTSEIGDFEKFRNGDNLDGVIFRISKDHYSDNVELQKGYSLIIYSNIKDITYNLSVEYNK